MCSLLCAIECTYKAATEWSTEHNAVSTIDIESMEKSTEYRRSGFYSVVFKMFALMTSKTNCISINVILRHIMYMHNLLMFLFLQIHQKSAICNY